MGIKEELFNLRQLSRTIDAKERELAQVRRYYKTLQGIDYSKEKLSGGLKCDFTDTVDKIIDLEREITVDIDELCDKKEYLNKQLKKILFGEEYLIIQMYFFEEMNNEEIAVKINRSYSTVKRTKRKAFEKILKVDPQ
ncbi:MAG: sigma factor-like helix-turn-helix DNA-binding protein [Peptoanaerobacter stomatis]|uniref:sigma factor-like helix-turn-helix DNA-binding protein n=1 Tax=Peptoanaerobacter stomatis TaxID=796937 RepID=UPI003FA09CFA